MQVAAGYHTAQPGCWFVGLGFESVSLLLLVFLSLQWSGLRSPRGPFVISPCVLNFKAVCM
jgi:hypothetical protein